MKLSNEELIFIVGGTLTGTLINSISRAISALLDMGRSLGTAIRRIASRNLCQLN